MATDAFTFVFTAGPISTDRVLGFHLERALGRVVEAEIEVDFPDHVEADDLLGQPAYFGYGRGAPEHELDGVVMSVHMTATPQDNLAQRGTHYRLHVTSLMGVLAQEHDFRIFQQMDVKEIVQKLLKDLAIDDKKQSWRVTGKLAKREYCVQYDETALAFVSRLLEEEGIYFYSESGKDGEVIVFDDDSTGADPIDGNATVPYRRGAGFSSSEDSIGVVTQRCRTATGKVTLRDYEFKKPDLDLTVTASADADSDIERYDYPGLYFVKDDGQKLVQVKLEALQAEREVIEVRSNCPRLTAGKHFKLADASDALDQEYLITSARHEMEKGKLVVHATMIPKKTKYRTPQTTPRPVLDGPQTATIVAPPGSPAEEIHTDEHARCKVKFHWDRYNKKDDSATAWMRTSQLQTSGSMILPRLGWEVIVEFLEGNPDRPIITGRVYNGREMPPYALPEGKSRTSLGTAQSPGGGKKNEIRMEDKAGKEEVMINSTKNTTIATANNKTVKTAVNETKNVKVNTTLTVGADQTIKVTNGFENTVGGAHTLSVTGNRKVEVNAVYGLTSGGASSTTVSGNQMEMDGNPIAALLALAVKAATEAAQAEAQAAMAQLDQAVSSRVDQAMGPINNLQSQVAGVAGQMDAVSNGNLGAAAGAMTSAAGLPSPSAMAGAMSPPSMSSATGLDALVHGAIGAAGDRLGQAASAAAGGGGGASAANSAGPDGAVGGNSASDSATGPGYMVNHCSATHTEHVGSIKAFIAAAGIHTTVTGARKQDVGAARVELVGGTRAETCSATKTEKAVGLVVLTKGNEDETVTGSRTTMVGGAVLEKIGASHSVTATGTATFVGAFHKIDASTAIIFKCGDSEVVIDGAGVTIKGTLITVTSPNVTITSTTAQG